MKSYRFRLAEVARVRAIEERVARERFLTSLRAARRTEFGYGQAKAALATLEGPNGLVSMHELQWASDQAERYSRAVTNARAALEEALRINREDREVWRLAAKRSSALERLDEQARVVWLADYRRDEAAALDDVVNARFVPNGGMS